MILAGVGECNYFMRIDATKGAFFLSKVPVFNLIVLILGDMYRYFLVFSTLFLLSVNVIDYWLTFIFHHLLKGLKSLDVK